jgi:hypothetical protein
MDPTPSGGLDPTLCPVGYTVRQGGTVYLPVAVPALSNVTGWSTGSDLVVHDPLAQPDGSIAIPVEAPHGIDSGDGDFGAHRRLIKIDTNVDGQKLTRQVLVVVSHITAAVNGDDSNPGTNDRPFATFAKAMDAAAKNDTIELDGFVAPATLPPPCVATSDGLINVKAGLTVIGQGMIPAWLPMDVHLDGDATLDNVELFGKPLGISTAGSTVALRNTKVHCGVNVSSGAGVDPSARASAGPSLGPMGTTLTITGAASQIWNDLLFNPPLIVDAIGAQVIIQNSASVLTTSTTMLSPSSPPPETVRFTGAQSYLSISGGAHVANSSGTVAIRIAAQPTASAYKPTNLYLDMADVTGTLVVEDTTATAQIIQSHFGGAGTAIEFHGKTLNVMGASFDGDGIVQNNPMSTVIVAGARVKTFPTFGYRLTSGTATIKDSDFSHSGAPRVSDQGPWALVVDADAKTDGTSNITSRMTVYDVQPPPTPCDIWGAPWDPAELAGLYNIAGAEDPMMKVVRIAFY